MDHQADGPAIQGGEPNGEHSHSRPGISRRKLILGGTAGAAALFAAHATGDFSRLGTSIRRREFPAKVARAQGADEFDDEPFDPAAVQSGEAGWYPSPYGPDDELGTLNEITPAKILHTWEQEILPSRAGAPRIYNMGEIMEPGMPAFGTRFYEQTIQPPSLGPDYAGDNDINGVEERISTTYQIATQIDGLPHIGVRDTFYNGVTADELFDPAVPSMVQKFGQHLVDPFMTRGILLDVLSVKLEEGADDALGEPVDGHPILGNSYRITVEDLQNAMDMARTNTIEPGDVVVIRTGWTHLFDAADEEKKARYVGSEPGIYLREARWLSQFRPAVIASDTWALEVLPAPDPWTGLQLFPVHQELITHHGIRIGEAFVSEELAADGVYRFLFFYTGQRARGATAANVAPGAFGSPTHARRP